MPDRNKVIEAFERCFCEKHSTCPGCYQDGPGFGVECRKALLRDVLMLLKKQKSLTQKMWNALFAEEDKLEKQFVGTDEHDKWFLVYRDWLQRGFGIAINVIAEQEEK